jgi:hypothetical protein
VLFQYPGLLPAESAIFRAWAAANPDRFDSVEFNVRVGPGFDPGPTWTPSQRQNAIANTQWRIDAIGWLRGQPTLIEVKYRAGTTALGALLGYRHHYTALYPQFPNPPLMLIAKSLQPNVEDPLRAFNIQIQLASPEPSVSFPSTVSKVAGI